MSSLQLLIKPSSGTCNLRCKYCFYHDVAGNRECENYGMMTRDTLEEIVRKAFAYADEFCGFAFQGGEPTLAGLDFYKDFMDMVKKYNKRGIPVQNSIQTNGFGLNEDWGKFLSEYNFLTGLSIDGILYTHDAFRVDPSGRGTFAAVMKTAELFHRYGVPFNILTVVNSRTAEKAKKIYSFYKKNGFSYLQFIACLDPIGDVRGSREYSLTPESYGEFLIELFELWYIDLERGCQPYIRQFENYVSVLLGYDPESCEQRGRCSLQHVIEADGSVYPCDFYVLDKYRLGSIVESSFEEIEKNGGKSGFLEMKDFPQDCVHCPYFALCRSGCRRHRDPEMSPGDSKNYFCVSYQMFFQAVLPRLRQIAGRLQMERLGFSRPSP